MAGSFYQAFVDVVPSAKGFGSALNKQIDPASMDAGKRAGDGIGGGILGGIRGIAGPLAAAVAGLGIGKMLMDSINNASDFQEAGTAITAVFGDADSTIQKFAAGAAQSLGQSTNQALDAARTFGVFGKAAGLSGQDLAGFSTDFVGLAADLASFNNTSPEQAIEALGAGLRGESEPLRAYGVLLDDAALKARATTLGIYSGTGALTQQQKVLAAQAEILAQTSTQQGDFGRTSGGLANQQRILAAQVENLSTSFGALLLPAMLVAVGALNTVVVPALTRVVDAFGVIVSAFNGEPPTVAVGAWTAPLTAFGETVRTIFDNVSSAVSAVSSILFKGDFTGGLFGIQEDNPAVSALFSVREAAILASSILFGGDFPGGIFGIEEDSPIVDMLFSIRESALGVFSALQASGGGILAAFAPLVPQVFELLSAFSPMSIVLQALLPLFPQLAALVGQFATVLGTLLGSTLAALTPLVQTFVTLLSEVLAAVLPVVGTLLTAVGQALAVIVPIISLVIAAVIPLITALVGGLIPPLMQLISAVLPVVVSAFQLVVAAIGPVVAILLGVFIPIVQSLIPVVTTVFGVIVNVITAALGIVQGIIDVVMGVISGNWGQAWNGILAILSGVWNVITAVVSGAINIVFSVIGAVLAMISGIWTNAWNAIGSFVTGAWNNITTSVSNGINTALGFIGSLPGRALSALGDLGGLFLASGRSLIQGFVDGITSMIGAVGDAVGGVMDFAAGFFPNSPADHGPLSGSGWTKILDSGYAVGDAFASGLVGSKEVVGKAATALMPTIRGRVSMSSAPQGELGTAASGSLDGLRLEVVDRTGGSLTDFIDFRIVENVVKPAERAMRLANVRTR